MPTADSPNALKPEALTNAPFNTFHSQHDDPEADRSLQPKPELEKRTPSPTSKPHSNYTSFLDRLKLVPEVRSSIPWRPGQELPPEKALDSTRVQQRGATLLSTRGNVMATPCELCAGGYGRFVVCVTLKNWFQGACSSCIFTSKGNKCSLRTQTSGTEDGRALRHHIDTPESHRSNPEKSSKKRKRSSVPGPKRSTALPTTYSSIYPQLDHPRAASPDLDMLLQAQIARDQMEEGESESESPVGDPPQPSQHPSRPNVAKPELPVRIPAVPSPYRSRPENQKPKARPLFSRDAAPMSQTGNETSHPVSSATWQDYSGRSKGSSMVSGIESFEKAKQRELYGIIGQCQGGIDDLQRQLDTLKALFGINSQGPMG
ncbi:hypothetical protein VTL71DRAFT_9157 [Oculimacula yallundae]|uniref:Uncharacterized protein n=1 Tax=Oculimacula yallundae TaxID=86028 RepID=A0ABR4BTY2_9HELO